MCKDKYIKLADLQKFPIRQDHYDKEHGNVHFIFGIETIFEYVDCLPKYEMIARSEWVSVEEQGKPTSDGRYLVCTKNNTVHIARYYDFRFCCFEEHNEVTHWMPLPELPEQNIIDNKGEIQ